MTTRNAASAARPKVRDLKRQANYLIRDAVADGIEDAWRDHVRLDGTRCSRKAHYVEDVLERDLIAKGILARPASPKARKRSGAA